MTTLQAKTPSRRFLLTAGIGAAAVAAVVAGTGFVSRAHGAHQNAQWSQAQSVPTVTLAKMQPDQASSIELPGTAQPFQKAQIYARVSGYLRSWKADIGTQVKAGQTLATVDTPDLDQQLAQAKGDLEMARANAKLADLTAQRWTALQKTGAVSQQIIDEKVGASAANRAVVDASLAKLRGVEALVAYKRIASPFTGIVTARKTDIGALINAGANGQELFEVSDLTKLRIYVQVPQTLAAKLKPGEHVDFTLPETPGKTEHATIAAISHALDFNTRTMLVQLQASNPRGAIGAGAYCKVVFQAAGTGSATRIPATALVPTANAGSQVAVLGAGNIVYLRSVKLGRDYGNEVDVVAGLAPGDRVIDSPPETLRNGDHVQLGKATGA
ncbi:efflux RND transporter periplasmic adaptor subunit [Sphingomonas nostoxanthinifaciens]|uniref:efflux RND transporter periplasmic adaptor subunit n=1 Tax=Sphingomonas nostoxanthinifaciens TaxID=2872652 RepID=UPI001CC1F510|nr:efflux RND transporter periplasmic adaptor subunit [Sphingomonas nostoxanthinifaciens]UAK23190.1 efflux RND transporter periplasmic adaptor subunit [Sphingomonas nostoxanthinifaciens]